MTDPVTPHPVTETRDGVAYLLVPLPEVERDGEWLCINGRPYLDDGVPDRWIERAMAATAPSTYLSQVAVLHARQAERRAVDKWLPGLCPACGRTGLFVADGGYVTCSNSGCPNPGAPYDACQAERTPTPEETP